MARGTVAVRGTIITHRAIGLRASARGAFSLVELMIAIAILGLGLVMVATMFPVAWDRARQLNEQTIRSTVVESATAIVRQTVTIAGPDLGVASLAGDVIFDSRHMNTGTGTVTDSPIMWYGDTLVHALHLENVRVERRAFVPENPWQVEQAVVQTESLGFLLGDGWRAKILLNTGGARCEFVERSFLPPRLGLHERIHPPMRPRRGVKRQKRCDGGEYVDDYEDEFEGEDVEWDAAFDNRRFAWAAFHRARETAAETIEDRLRYPDTDTKVPAIRLIREPYKDPYGKPQEYHDDFSTIQETLYGLSSSARSFDLYIVTLRRPNANRRYARQDPDAAPPPKRSTKDDETFFDNVPPVAPGALPPDEDVRIPVPWRVGVTITGNPEDVPRKGEEVGVPTEMRVPPIGSFSDAERRMAGQMFRKGTKFIDEVSGAIYEVVKRREIDTANDEHVLLTIDTELTIEDVDGYQHVGCATCAQSDGLVEKIELRRTVWVFPPAVSPDVPREDEDPYPFFEGKSPVVDIDVRTVTLSPDRP